MRLDHLRTLLATIEQGSVAGGARDRAIGRATARRHLRALEADLGVPLLVDGAPTPAGRILRREGETLIAEAEALLASARRSAAAAARRVEVLLPPGLPPDAMPMVHHLVLGESARHATSWVVADPADELLRRGDLAIALAPGRPPGPWAAPLLARVDRRLVAARSWLVEHGEPRSLEEVSRRPLLWYEAFGGEVRGLPRVDGEPIEVEPIVVSNDVHQLRAMVAAGLGIGWIPAGGPGDTEADSGLVEILPGQAVDRLGVYLLLPDRARSTAHLQRVAAAIRQVAEALRSRPLDEDERGLR